MSDPNPFGEKKQGLFSRLLNRAARLETSRVVRRTELLNLLVPAARADSAKAAVEHWLAGHGIDAMVTSEDAGEGNIRLRTSLDQQESEKLDLSSPAIQSELENVLIHAVEPPPAGSG